MTTLTTIFSSIMLVSLAFSIYVLARNEYVFKFRTWIIVEMSKSEYWRELEQEYNTVSYISMILSFKPLRIKYWFSEDFCEKINAVK